MSITMETSAPPTRGRSPALLSDIVADFDVTILPLNATSRPRCTKAGATLAKLLASHGEAHLRDVLTIILENKNETRERALVAPVIRAISVVLLAHSAAYEQKASRWLDVMDDVDLVWMNELAKMNQRAVPSAEAIATLLFLELSAELNLR